MKYFSILVRLTTIFSSSTAKSGGRRRVRKRVFGDQAVELKNETVRQELVFHSSNQPAYRCENY